MEAQNRLSAVIEQLKDGTGHHPTIVAELEAVWAAMDQGHTARELAALIEEMTSKGYDQMKARTLTAVEAATGQTDIGSKPLGRQIGFALDDARRVMMDLLARRAPEVTPAMLTEAAQARYTSERKAAMDADVDSAEERVKRLRADLAEAERRLAGGRSESERRELLDILSKGGPAVTSVALQAVKRSII